MTASTLLVSLDGIKLGGITEVVQARGIDRVIVVAAANQFNEFANTDVLGKVSEVKSKTGAKIELALNTGTSFSINNAAFEAIRTSGFEFLDDPGLTSLTGALVATDGLISVSSEAARKDELPIANFPRFGEDNLDAQNTLDGNLKIGVNTGFGSKSTITFTESVSSLSDFNGSIVVNLTTAEFTTLIQSNDGNNISFAQVTSPVKLSVDSVSRQAVKSNVAWGNYYKISTQDVANSNSPIGNLEGVSPTKSTVATGYDAYFWAANGSLNAEEALNLPLMGVAPHATPSEGGGNIVLKDTAANLEVLLPQLTQAQLASFTSIEISDSGILDLDPSTFTRLDKAVHFLPWTNNVGISLKNSNGADVSLRLVADQLSDLSSEKLLYNGEFVDKVSGSAGQNLVGLVDPLSLEM